MEKENGFARVSRSSLLNATLDSWGLFRLCHTSPYSVQRSSECQSSVLLQSPALSFMQNFSSAS